MRSIPSELDPLAHEQDGVLSRQQLAELGWNHDHVRRAVAAGKWASYGLRAVVLHRGPLSARQQRWVAIINGGPSATLAGLTAAHELGLVGFETPTIHLVVPRGGWVPRPQAGVTVHVSRRFSIHDRHPARRLPTVRIERALLDAAVWTANQRRAAAILLAGVQQRLATPGSLRRELNAAGRVRHRRLLRTVIADAEGGVHALAELDFTHLCRQYGLPEPTRQVRRRDASGTLRYLDVRLVGKHGRSVNLEIDGAAHFRITDASADLRRDLALLAEGETVIRVPAYLVRADPAALAAQIHDALNHPAA